MTYDEITQRIRNLEPVSEEDIKFVKTINAKELQLCDQIGAHLDEIELLLITALTLSQEKQIAMKERVKYHNEVVDSYSELFEELKNLRRP